MFSTFARTVLFRCLALILRRIFTTNRLPATPDMRRRPCRHTHEAAGNADDSPNSVDKTEDLTDSFSSLSCAAIEHDEYKYANRKHSDHILAGLNALRSSGAFCDVRLCVEEVEYPCHRVVLASCSPYFKAMFSNEMAERTQNRVVLNGVEADTLRDLLEYAYTSKITISRTNVQSLLSAANLLDISPIRETCCSFLEHHMDQGNCLGIHRFAEIHSCTDLQEKARDFACYYFTQVMRQDEFLQISANKLAEFLSSDALMVEKEELVFEGLLSWYRHSPDTRKEDFERILEHVRLPLISPYYLNDSVATVAAISQSPKCRELLEEAKSYHLLPDRRRERHHQRTVPRGQASMTEVAVLVGGEDEKVVLRNVDCYVFGTNSWLSLASLPFAVSKHGVAATGHNFLFMVGGEFPDGSVSKATWRFDPALNVWNELAPIETARSELGVATLDGLVYAVGGWDGSARLSCVERYDPSSNFWEPLEPLKTPLTNPALASLDGRLYVVGGAVLDDGDGVDLVQCYDPKTDAWTKLAPMLISRSGAAACVFNGRLFVIGGWHASYENTNKVECYDPKTNCWEFRKSMKERRYKPGAAVVGRRILVFGGEESWDRHHVSMEAYDPEADRWCDVWDMPLKRSWLGCATVSLPIHMLGGDKTWSDPDEHC
ncbi:unnamed protein product [Ixodes persulcatus]